MPGLSTHLGKKSGYHGDPLLPLRSVTPNPPPPRGSIRQSLKNPLQPFALLKGLFPHWEPSDLVGMIPGSHVTGTEAESAALAAGRVGRARQTGPCWCRSPPLPHPLPREGRSGPEPLNVSDTLTQGEVSSSGMPLVEGERRGGLYWMKVGDQETCTPKPSPKQPAASRQGCTLLGTMLENQ